MEEHAFACSWDTRTTLSPREIPASHQLGAELVLVRFFQARWMVERLTVDTRKDFGIDSS